MTGKAIPSPNLHRLLRRTRNRLWQQNAASRLTTGCYLSAGIALILMAVHLLVINVSALLWWIVVSLPLIIRLPGALVSDRPDSVTNARFADNWFATQELFTSAQYVNQMPPSRRSDNVPQQIRTSAESAATQLLASNAPRPKVSADPRITIAALLIGLSALVTLPNATPIETTNQIDTPSANNRADNDKTSWLVATAPEAAPAESDIPQGPGNDFARSTPTNPDRNSTDKAADGFDDVEQQVNASTFAAAEVDLLEHAEIADEKTTPALNDQSGTRLGSNSESGPAVASEAAQGSQPRQQTAASTPISTQTSILPLEYRSSQITAQAGTQAGSDQAGQPNAEPADKQLNVVADTTDQPTQADTTDLAQQQWGPIARTLAARYAQVRQP